MNNTPTPHYPPDLTPAQHRRALRAYLLEALARAIAAEVRRRQRRNGKIPRLRKAA